MQLATCDGKGKGKKYGHDNNTKCGRRSENSILAFEFRVVQRKKGCGGFVLLFKLVMVAQKRTDETARGNHKTLTLAQKLTSM